MSFRIYGNVKEKETGKGISNLLVKAIDKDMLVDDLLGTAVTDEDGRFEINYEKEDFQELFFDRKPDIYLHVKNQQGDVIYTTEDKVRYGSGKTEVFEIPITRNLIPKKLPERLKLQDPKKKIANPATIEEVKWVATAHAMETWGPAVACGKPIPVINENNEPVLFACPIAIDDIAFPDLYTLIEKFSKADKSFIKGEEQGLGRVNAKYQSHMSAILDDLKKFGTVFISASKDGYPVTRISHQLHPYFYNAEMALAMVNHGLGMSDAKLLNIRLKAPCYEYFEIACGDSIKRVHVHTLIGEEAMQAAYEKYHKAEPVEGHEMPDMQGLKKGAEKAWAYYSKLAGEPGFKLPPPLPAPTPGSTFYTIPYSDRLPPILWTRWCAPTAMAMVFSYWDHYVPVPGIGTHVGNGRIVDYWLNHPTNDNNVPNLLDEIVNECSSYEEFANTRNKYNWTFSTAIGTAQNDYAWNDIVAELSAGRPARWQYYGPNMPHALCAFGYRIANSGAKYVVVYNTWTETPDEWLYNSYAGVPVGHIELNRYVPGDKDLYRYLFIREPYGGEIYHVGEWIQILFALHPQTDIKKLRLEYSIDGGQSWNFMIELWANPGWNTWHWKAPTTTNKARIRIKGRSQTNEFLAADGSFRNFTIQ